MFHYDLSTLSVSFYLFFQMKRPTHTHKKKKNGKKKGKRKDYAGILFPHVVPLSMKIEGGDEKLFMDSLPPHKCFPPVSARIPGLCMTQFHPSGLCPFAAGEALEEFPSHLKVKYLHQTDCICLAAWVTWLLHFPSICWGALCVCQTGYGVGIIAHILCMTTFYLLFVLL